MDVLLKKRNCCQCRELNSGRLIESGQHNEMCLFVTHTAVSSSVYKPGVRELTGFYSLEHILFPVRVFLVLVLLPLLLGKLFYTKYLTDTG